VRTSKSHIPLVPVASPNSASDPFGRRLTSYRGSHPDQKWHSIAIIPMLMENEIGYYLFGLSTSEFGCHDAQALTTCMPTVVDIPKLPGVVSNMDLTRKV